VVNKIDKDLTHFIDCCMPSILKDCRHKFHSLPFVFFLINYSSYVFYEGRPLQAILFVLLFFFLMCLGGHPVLEEMMRWKKQEPINSSPVRISVYRLINLSYKCPSGDRLKLRLKTDIVTAITIP